MRRLVAVCLLMCFVLPSWAAEELPEEGRIVFQVIHGDTGLEIGVAEHRWRYEGSRYEMSNTVETTGLAAVLADFHYVQRSEGRVIGRELRPQSFVVDQRGRERESAAFDWGGKSVLIMRRKGRQEVFPLVAGDVDVLSVWHVVAMGGTEQLPKEMSVVNNRNASYATMVRLGVETIQLPLGAIEAQRVRLKATSGKLTIDLWLSPEYAFLPLRVHLTDRKGKTLDLRATEVRMGAQD